MAERALIFSYSDCANYFAGTTEEPLGQSSATQLLKNSLGKPQKFPSLYAAQKALAALGYEQGWLVMHSPYDEMLGNETASLTEMPLNLTHTA